MKADFEDGVYNTTECYQHQVPSGQAGRPPLNKLTSQINLTKLQKHLKGLLKSVFQFGFLVYHCLGRRKLGNDHKYPPQIYLRLASYPCREIHLRNSYLNTLKARSMQTNLVSVHTTAWDFNVRGLRITWPLILPTICTWLQFLYRKSLSHYMAPWYYLIW
jgi:hypothetical protein